MSKKSDVYKKWGVILIGLLFLGSMAGIALNTSGSGPGGAELPEEFVLYEDLTDAQRNVFYNMRGTVVVFTSDPLCGFECGEVRSKLEALASKYQYADRNFVYLVLLQDDGDMSISVGNYHGVVDVETADEVEDRICEVVEAHPACIERGAISAVMNYNYTRNETADEADNETVDDGDSEAVNETEELEEVVE